MPIVTIPNRWEPRAYQKPIMAYLDNGGRRAMWVLHRRGGKDLTMLHQTCKMMHVRQGPYWHFFPTGEQGRRALWEGFTKDGQRIMEQVFPAPIRKFPREWRPGGEMIVELKCGSVWRLLGSDKMEVVGASPIGVVFSEYALCKPTTWNLVRPMLQENGGWATFITTPRGNNHAKQLYEMARTNPAWFCDLKTLLDTRAYDPEVTISEERASGMPEELIAQEYLCDWSAANVGSFYGVLLAALDKQGRTGAAFETPGDDVFTTWDLGRADDTAIWWWRLRDGSTRDRPRVDVLDHYASHGDDVGHYLDVLEERARRHGWRYRKHFLPHDARAKTLATRVSVLDQFIARVTATMVAVIPALSLKDGIQATRWLLGQDIRFHARCSVVAPGGKDCDGVEALRSYHRTWDDDRKCFSEAPVHDWSSHTADAFREMALVVKRADDMLAGMRPPPPPPPVRTTPPTFDEFWSQKR